MTTSIEDMKLRIKTLENLVQGQSESFVEGYITALQDNSLLLTDVNKDELQDRFKAMLYSKMLK